MHDTAFTVPLENQHKVMASYEYDPIKNNLSELISDPQKIGNYGYPLQVHLMQGVVADFSTLNDYAIFAKMLHSGTSNKGSKSLIPYTKLMSTNF